MLKKLNNWGFLNWKNAGNKSLEMTNREIRYISMAILEMRLKAWKKDRMFNFSLQSVFIYTSMHDGKVLCQKSISETSSISPCT
jgi:hypothetical protein